ncbi:MAG: non-homologous end-joining DNA ligase [Actinomycetota bacterium]|nr:non-homologous end-joining DNA ligase [Actinomycetota bacterium]
MASRKDYPSKRTFDKTPEPEGRVRGNLDPAAAAPGKTFVIQQHHARRLHFDLRLEMHEDKQPVLVSWAVPRNLPRKKGDGHLAVHVEDHPMEYADFSGTIPEGNYGAGEVRIFDTGTYELHEQDRGKLTIELSGERVRGVYHMVRTSSEEGKDEWLVFLKEDKRPPLEELPSVTPMFATPSTEAFDDDDWIFEPKWDGVRTLAVCGEEQTKLLSRRGNDVTETYPELKDLQERIVALDAVVDGEIVAFENGRPSFERLQGRMNLQNARDVERAVKKCPITYVLFDVIYLDGRQVCDRPIEERKLLLDGIVVPSKRVQVSPVVEGEGVALSRAAGERGLEGVVAKKLGSPYRPGRRSRDWLKIKVVHDTDVVVGGWSRGEGSRATSFGSLLVGAYTEEGLTFLGAVGTGFSQKTLDDLMGRLQKLRTDRCPFLEGSSGIKGGRFGKPIKNPSWVEPELVAKVEFRELTSQLKLRAPSFKGLRTDKRPEDCLVSELEALRPA